MAASLAPVAPTPDIDTPLVDAAQAQHVGRRDAQQDAVGFSPLADRVFVRHGGQLAVLADGMGGLHNGRWAASHAVQAFIETYQGKAVDEAVAVALQRALAAANAVVHDEAVRVGAVDRMGSTLAVAVVCGTDLHWLNVGNSRVYLCEDGRLRCLSTDHSFEQRLQRRVQRGELSAEEARIHPLRHALTSYLGRPVPPQHAASPVAVPLRPGACVLLCSDGLTQALGDAQIGALLRGPAQAACDRLLQAVLLRALPEQDNITVAVLQLPPDGRPDDGAGTDASDHPDALDDSAEADVVHGPTASDRHRSGRCADPGARRPPGGASAGGPSRPSGEAGREVPGVLRRLAPHWREPLWWGGAVAAVAAVTLLWLARAPATSPASAPGPAGRSGPAVDLLSAPAATPSGRPEPSAPAPPAKRAEPARPAVLPKPAGPAVHPKPAGPAVAASRQAGP